jgi:hypothetical protein
MHLRDAPPLLKELAPNVPQEISQLVESMLDKHSEARPTMTQVAAELLRLERQQSEPLPAPSAGKPLLQSPLFWLASLSLLILGLIGLLLSLTVLKR